MRQNEMSLEKPTLNSAATTARTPPSQSSESPPFSEKEREMFRNEDYGAARLIVEIMASVFAVGLALYIFIACLVALGGH